MYRLLLPVRIIDQPGSATCLGAGGAVAPSRREDARAGQAQPDQRHRQQPARPGRAPLQAEPVRQWPLDERTDGVGDPQRHQVEAQDAAPEGARRPQLHDGGQAGKYVDIDEPDK